MSGHKLALLFFPYNQRGKTPRSPKRARTKAQEETKITETRSNIDQITFDPLLIIDRTRITGCFEAFSKKRSSRGCAGVLGAVCYRLVWFYTLYLGTSWVSTHLTRRGVSRVGVPDEAVGESGRHYRCRLLVVCDSQSLLLSGIKNRYRRRICWILTGSKKQFDVKVRHVHRATDRQTIPCVHTSAHSTGRTPGMERSCPLSLHRLHPLRGCFCR